MAVGIHHINNNAAGTRNPLYTFVIIWATGVEFTHWKETHWWTSKIAPTSRHRQNSKTRNTICCRKGDSSQGRKNRTVKWQSSTWYNLYDVLCFNITVICDMKTCLRLLLNFLMKLLFSGLNYNIHLLFTEENCIKQWSCSVTLLEVIKFKIRKWTN